MKEGDNHNATKHKRSLSFFKKLLMINTKRIIIVLAGSAFSFFVLSTCTKTKDNCISFTKTPVTKVEGANTGLVNQDLIFTVSFQCFNGCGQFGSFEQTTNGDSTIINVIAKYEGCVCTQNAPTRQTVYKFKATQPGIYYLKFWQGEKGFLTDTIKIN
jgi:hypothetical protein